MASIFRKLSISSNASSDSDNSLQTSRTRSTSLDKYLSYRSHNDKRYIYDDNDMENKTPRGSSRLKTSDFQYNKFTGKDPDGILPRKNSDPCLKCLMKMPHKKCGSHKYIRIGGGYRHGYYFLKALLEEIDLRRQQDELLRRRLEPISEGNVRAIKTYIRTKSGRLIEKIVFVSDEDYNKIMAGGDPSKILANYLTKDEMEQLDSVDKDEQIAVKTYIRTKSGRMIEKTVYVSKKDYEAMLRGEIDDKKFLRERLGLKSGEQLEGWKESKMRTITMKVRTKSGRIIEKQIQISEEDYKKLQEGGNLDDILKKYVKPDVGSKIVGWDKSKKPGMKVVKTYVRTKSGRIIEKTILMTEEEYKEFQKSKNDPNFLKKFLNLKEGETIDRWEKQSTVYEGSDDEELLKAKPGQKIKDKDGNEYEVIVDPLTGKKYKKLINKNSNKNNPIGFKTKDGRFITEKDIKKRKDLKEGKRNEDSNSDYSYKSFVSAGGTRHVKRRKKNADGTRGDSESYHSSQDEDGKARRRNRRRERKHGADSAHSYYSVVSEGGTRHVRRRKRNADGTRGDSESYHSHDSEEFAKAEKAIKQQKEKLKQGENDKKGKNKNKVELVDSDHSYYSEVSAGGTKRKLKRKRIRDDHGNVIGYGESIEHDGTGKAINKGKGKKTKNHGSDSEHSYYSEISEGGTRRQKRRKRIRDKDGKVVGYGKAEDYSSSDEKKKKKKTRGGPDSDYSYESYVSEGGTKRKMKKKRIRDKDGNIIGHEKAEKASSSEESFITVSDGKGGKMKVKNPKKMPKKYSAVFSDATTDSDIVREKMKNMTEEEKKKYLEERAKRGEEREKKRKEKYGDKYEEMKELYKKKKEVYQKKKEEEIKEKEIKEKERKEKEKRDKEIAKAKAALMEGIDADIEDSDNIIKGKKKKVTGRPGTGSTTSSVEVIRDKDGRILKKIKRDKDGNLIEEEYDKDGNVISRKKKGKNENDFGSSDDDGDYFIRDKDGRLRLKPGKKKIDLKNLTKEELEALGIDPNLSKAEQLRKLKEIFGDDIDVVYGKKKIGVKDVNDYSDANTSNLANDSDVDVDTAKPRDRERIIAKKMGQTLQDHMKNLIEQSMLKEYQSATEKLSQVDFLSAYRLVDPNYLNSYANFFAIEDHDDADGIINYKGCVTALNNLKRTGVIKNLTDKQMEYMLSTLGINKHSDVSFRMFSVLAALGDRITKLDAYCRDLLEISSLLDIERKLKYYLDLFYMNESSDVNPNYIKVDSIIIDLRAGGLSKEQWQFVISKLHPNDFKEISFLDFLSYIPLFMSYHEKIIGNPLDMSDKKYTFTSKRRASIQRDMNPLGYPMSRESQFYQSHYGQKNQAPQISSLTDNLNVIGVAKKSMTKYSPLPSIKK